MLTFHDAGHILGSSIVELTNIENGEERTLVFSGDLGYRDAPVMDPPVRLAKADAVVMESTYGDRLHRDFEATVDELTELFDTAGTAQGNILIPAFTVGRTQDLLYLMSKNEKKWGLDKWKIFVDSPMGIAATNMYARYRNLYGVQLFKPGSDLPNLPNIYMTRSTEESMTINPIKSGAIIIAGSGMCSGGRIQHHLKNNIWRPECHLVIVGYQAHGTLGRRIVDGVEKIRLWGEFYPVRATVHPSADCRRMRIRPIFSVGIVPLTASHPSTWCTARNDRKRRWRKSWEINSTRRSQSPNTGRKLTLAREQVLL